MAIFRVQTRLAHDSPGYTPYKWSYLWYVNTDTLGDAVTLGEQIWEALRPAHSLRAFCYELYVSDVLPTTVTYTLSPIAPGNQRGTAPAVSNLLPSFNVVRVDLNAVSSRPSRKFHRLPLGEDQLVNGELASSSATAIRDAFDLAAGLANVCDESGNPFTGVVVKGITSRRLGKFAYTAVPSGPALG